MLLCRRRVPPVAYSANTLGVMRRLPATVLFWIWKMLPLLLPISAELPASLLPMTLLSMKT